MFSTLLLGCAKELYDSPQWRAPALGAGKIFAYFGCGEWQRPAMVLYHATLSPRWNSQLDLFPPCDATSNLDETIMVQQAT